MLGAIIGDIAGSMYERKRYRIKTKDFPFFGKYCRFTDDTVCTIAVSDALLQKHSRKKDLLSHFIYRIIKVDERCW